ncbi:MAG: hypothetical protein NWF00_04320 [Candidatus Bathyarchaeota archaeon]|nr:hypothetical protein [Candidatus Bathyarchaeota archaeon]
MQKKFCASVIVFLLAMSIAVVSLPSVTKAQTVSSWDFEDQSFDHVDFTTLTDAEMIEQLTLMDTLFQDHELPEPLHFAYPDGAYNAAVVDVVDGYRFSDRNAASATTFETYPVADWYSLSADIIDSATTFAFVQNLIDQTVAADGLLNLFTHEVTDPPMPQGTTPTILTQILDYLGAQQDAGNLEVMTIRQARNAYDGTKAVVVMAFDDSYATDHDVVWPLFQERGLVGTSYLVGGAVGSPGRLTWEMIEEMSQTEQETPEPIPAVPVWAVEINVTPTKAGRMSYPTGATVLPQYMLYIEAFPAQGYSFSHWLFDNETLSSNPVVLPSQTVGSFHTLTAVFTNGTTNVTTPVPQPTTWSLTVNSTVGGTTTPSGIVNATNSITVNTTASSNYSFSYWQFDALNVTSIADLALYNVTSTNTTSIITVPKQTAGTNHTLTAFFANSTIPQP